MIKSLKKIVIFLGILVTLLLIIVISTLITRLNYNNDKNFPVNIDISDKISRDFDIMSFYVENGKIFIHLKSIEIELIKVVNLKSGKIVKDIYIKNNDK